MAARPPKGWALDGRSGEVACPHRSLSVCPACDAERVEAVEVYGVHYWMPNRVERESLIADMEANPLPRSA